MLAKLILLFTLLPAVELILLLLIGEYVGLWPTLGLIAFTGIAGALLAKSQGLRVVRRIQEDLAAGRTPAYGLIDGLLILIGGALLLTPGLLTDLAGLSMMLPFFRNLVKRRLQEAIERGIRSGRWQVIRYGPGPDDEEPPSPGPSGWHRIR